MVVSERLLKASFEVSYVIALAVKLLHIAETLLLPAAIELEERCAGRKKLND